MIEIRGVSKSYNQHRVLDNVSLTIEKGTITSFIGPNGAGKSTLLSLLSRFITPDEGVITLDGKNVEDYAHREYAKRLSTLKQSNHTNLRLTIRELVSFGRFPHTQGRLTAEDWKYIDRAIDYMNLGDIQHKLLSQLSGGQRQAAYIAMVVAQDTEYILLDEPLNNLDMKHSVEIMRLLSQLVRDLGKTIVIVVHDINFAASYSDHIVALKDGRLVCEGCTNTVVCAPALKQIFDMDIRIEEVNNQRICVYHS